MKNFHPRDNHPRSATLNEKELEADKGTCTCRKLSLPLMENPAKRPVRVKKTTDFVTKTNSYDLSFLRKT
jgi:hypothetical protein